MGHGLWCGMDASRYRVGEKLKDGRSLELRALEPADREGLRAAVAGLSDESLYRRFFAARRDFSEREMDYFIDVDFLRHVALVAVMEEAGKPVIVGGGRYVVSEPGVAEVAFTVDDAHRGLGIASALLRSLAAIAREAGLKTFVAEVLPDNGAMLRVFERSGLRATSRRAEGVVHLAMELG